MNQAYASATPGYPAQPIYPPYSAPTPSYSTPVPAPQVTNIPSNQRQSIAQIGHYDDTTFHNMPLDYNTHGDAGAVSYEEYRQAAYSEAMYNQGQQHHVPMSPPPPPMKSHSNTYPATAMLADYRDEPDATTPMIKGNPYRDNNKASKRPHGAITMAPEDEAASYRPKQYHDDHGRGGNCCCNFCAEITCCSCFCLLISVAFLAGGIALIVAASIFASKCAANCDSAITTDLTSACDTFCNKYLHDGLLYSGIGIAALAGISIIWRILNWMCGAAGRR
ncbi:hypothetical protein DM01DRAFT_1331776 [Hesseltinella vesiculosa]|uniref:Uncharacterized protein n=1 Tax=Hesseltinella vesiculosa TaxID=101127 RepID=A0A1X2GWI3_9FUNG|nr:hypothetical protein DM01DRAFT_1331776 [Hesseltinella vesiculosa]